ncbi:unnamed protein product [Cylicostephanus goldi]|uniref:RRM domain-containing protein n=1 Tax=Cylicostephanus goldi TaxID=71465 RepID=A0A3P6TH64_CYLGO|nr:unnamed protein product [Cylicostephanus goldi]
MEKDDEVKKDETQQEENHDEHLDDDDNGDNKEGTEIKHKLPQTTYVRLRGLPYSSKESDIRAFLDGIPVTSITMSSSYNGRPSGECYCELTSKQDVLKSLDFHCKEMEGRYIESKYILETHTIPFISLS